MTRSYILHNRRGHQCYQLFPTSFLRKTSYSHSVAIISGAWLAKEDTIKDAIKDLDALIGTGYYDDGDEILIPVRNYLVKQLKNQTLVNQGE